MYAIKADALNAMLADEPPFLVDVREAAEIEKDRQNYGDFGRFEALERVKGLGPAKLKVLRPFFVEGDNITE